MQPTDYNKLTAEWIVSLAIYREARGEFAHNGLAPLTAVGNVIRNRVKSDTPWWKRGSTVSVWHGVVLQPYQFSSFNHGDPNEKVWPNPPSDDVWHQCYSVGTEIVGGGLEDNTSGACWYHDSSIAFPEAWGAREDYDLTLQAGRLSFYRLLPAPSNREQIQDAAAGEN
jgi:hypothetical protein